MSGPKVIRVVSQQEMEAIKALQVSRLQSAIQDLQRYSNKHNIFDDKQWQEINHRLTVFQNMDSKLYRRIESEIPAQIEFLLAEKSKAEATVKKRSLSQFEKYRNLSASIVSLRKMYERRSLNIPDFVRQYDATRIWITERDLDLMETHIRAAFARLGEADVKEDNNEAAEFRQRLKGDQKNMDYETWLQGAKLIKPSKSILRLESMMSDLVSADIEEEGKQLFLERVQSLLNHPPSQQLDMKIDSLSIDIKTHIHSARKMKASILAFNLALDNLTQLRLTENLSTIDLENATIEDIDNATAALTKHYEDEVIAKNAELKRVALLKAFGKLGYNVNNHLETAYVKNGRLVMGKASESPYGVELASSPNMARLQVRVVAKAGSESQRSTALDKAEEQRWCQDFTSLSNQLTEEGLLIEIDRQLEPGESIVKAVDFDDAQWDNNSSQVKPTIHQRFDN